MIKYCYIVTITFETADAVPRAKIGRYCRDAINYGSSDLLPSDPLYDIQNIRVPHVEVKIATETK